MISRLREILVKLSKVLPSPEKAHLFANPPQTLLSDAFTGTRLHKACPEWAWGQNFVYKGNEKEIVGDKTQL